MDKRLPKSECMLCLDGMTLRCTCIQRLVRISLVIRKSDKQARDVLTVSWFFCIPLDETIANTYFLALFYCSGHLIP